jgi:arylsulfatase A-like enzyme
MRKNILWICADQLRFDYLGCYGNKIVRTPNIDRLASMGMIFKKAYVQSPVCAPSRASFLTGRYPRTCRVRQNGQNIPKEEILVTKVLADNGYVCGLSGKLHISACYPHLDILTEPRIDDGYSEFDWSHGPAGLAKKRGWFGNDYGKWLFENGVEYKTPSHPESSFISIGMPEEYHQTKWCTDKALSFIERAKMYEKNWLFSVNYFDPHNDYDPPKEYLDYYMTKLDEIPLPDFIESELKEKPYWQQKDHLGAYDSDGELAYDSMTDRDHKLIRAAYYGMVELIDKQVGRLMDKLESIGELENTMVIFTSDHGEMLGDNGVYLKGPYFYEQCIHVPLIIYNGKSANRSYDGLLEIVDLAPTILDAAELPVEPGMQGKSFLSVFTGDETKYHRDDIYCESYNSNKGHRDPLAYTTMVFDGRYKLTRAHGDESKTLVGGELYDLEKDPAEHNNLWDDRDYIEIKCKMLEKLSDRMAWTADPLPVRSAVF